ncbi:MAG: signal peptidase I [Pseudohongiellaceae bacterium]|nr:signal peptidase I [Pseudohongiellaceae bacterium]
MKKFLSAFWAENRKFLFLLLTIVFFKSAIADLNSISGSSMQPTLLDGDKVWVNKLAYDVRIPFTDIFLGSVSDPNRGDIIIIDSKAANKRLVKRIIGVPGDTVYMRDNTLVINGQPADYEIVSSDSNSLIIRESLLDHSHRAMLSGELSGSSRNFGPEVVPQDQFFVLGDNRDNSADSRIYSFIPREQIIGRSNSVVFSLDSERNFLPRADRFLSELQ